MLNPDIASTQETLECWAESWGGTEMKITAPAFYWSIVYIPAELLVAFLVIVVVNAVTESARAHNYILS